MQMPINYWVKQKGKEEEKERERERGGVGKKMQWYKMKQDQIQKLGNSYLIQFVADPAVRDRIYTSLSNLYLSRFTWAFSKTNKS